MEKQKPEIEEKSVMMTDEEANQYIKGCEEGHTNGYNSALEKVKEVIENFTLTSNPRCSLLIRECCMKELKSELENIKKEMK